MAPINFAKITKKNFDTLARGGKVGPYKNDFHCIGAVLNGEKPVAIVDRQMAEFVASYQATGYGYHLFATLVPHLADAEDGMAKYAIYTNIEAFNRLCAAFELLSGEDRSKTDNLYFHIELGRALGYSDKDIAAYIKQNYNYQIMKKYFSNNELIQTEQGLRYIKKNDAMPGQRQRMVEMIQKLEKDKQ